MSNQREINELFAELLLRNCGDLNQESVDKLNLIMNGMYSLKKEDKGGE